MIFQNAIWSFRNDDEKIQTSITQLNIDPLVAKLLVDRGVTTEVQAHAFRSEERRVGKEFRYRW